MRKRLMLAIGMLLAAAFAAKLFYDTPVPVFDHPADVRSVRFSAVPAGEYPLALVDLSDEVDGDAVIQLLHSSTRSSWKQECLPYELSPGEINIDMHVEGKGPLHVILGGSEGALNVVYSSAEEGCYEIHNSDALRAELAALLP